MAEYFRLYTRKGEGLVLGKLKIITLIEADWKCMMRMYLGEEEEEIIKGDSRFSKLNCSLRKNS